MALKKRITIFQIVNGGLLSLFALLCLYPFVNQVLISFASPADYLRGGIFVIPREFNLESYKFILFQGRVLYAFLMSMFTTIVGTVVNMLLTSFGSYALTKKDLPGRKIFFIMILITMFFGGGLIPFFIIVRELGLTNNVWGLIFPFAINTFNMIILRNFFSSVPESVIESCKIDGGNDFHILFQFVIPMSLAGMATIALFYIVERWNDWYWPLVFMSRTEYVPLALELRNILTANQSTGLGGGEIDPSLKFSVGQQAATIVIAILPILVIYPFVQSYFVKGVMLGSVKE